MNFFNLLQVIGNPALNQTISAESGGDYLSGIIPAAVAIIFVVGAVLFLLMFVLGGISWISSAGDKATVEAARSRVSNALIGLLILFSLFAIVGAFEYIFRINIMSFGIGDNAFEIETYDYTAPPASTPTPAATPVPTIPQITAIPSRPAPTPIGPVNPNCLCSAPLGGGCARTNQVAIGPGSGCYLCTDSGWQSLTTTTCRVIRCSPCP